MNAFGYTVGSRSIFHNSLTALKKVKNHILIFGFEKTFYRL